jgi:hypothetical protein
MFLYKKYFEIYVKQKEGGRRKKSTYGIDSALKGANGGGKIGYRDL